MPPFFDVHGDPQMDPYTILSLPPTASEAEIKRSYRMQMLQLHPDKLAPTLSEQSIAAVSEKFHNVKDAYEFLISPLHLTSRRLYMARMASRRAEYERREAYIRRNGGTAADSFYSNATSNFTPNYRSGGGGGAGMAGTTFSQQPSMSASTRRSNNNSYAMPSRKKAQAESRGDTGNDKKDRGRRSSGVGGGPSCTNASQTDGGKRTPSRSKRREKTTATGGTYRTGYKSDSHHDRKSKSSNDYDGGIRYGGGSAARKSTSFYSEMGANATKPKKNDDDRGHRGKSEEPDAARKRTTTTKDKLPKSKSHFSTTTSARWGDVKIDTELRDRQKRQRTKSAPARYAAKDDRRAGSDGGIKWDKHYPNTSSSGQNNNNNISSDNLPKEFFCPLTKKIMKDPVKDSEGNVYEREAIERWLRVQSSSPITNRYLSMDMIRQDKELKRSIFKTTGRPRAKSQAQRGKSPHDQNDMISGRVLIDSYLRAISSKSKLNIALDGVGICAFSYRRITFVIEVPVTAHAGFMVYSSFDGEADRYKLTERMDAWNDWLEKIGRHSSVHHIKSGRKTVFSLKGAERDMTKCEIFQKTLEYFVQMSLKLHNLLHPLEMKTVENVSLTRHPVAVT